jgi:NAD(P)-dependent dehydrogenase (short-subunit alcohol dehydrogenase family)
MMQREHQRHERLVVVVTGGSAGIGRAIAQAFARRGARVAVLARGNDRLASTRGDIEQLGGEALVLPTDVADPQQVEAAADEVERRWGAIDAWINNAMATTFSPVADITADDVRRATEVTYLGAVWGTMAALRRMKPRDRGVIVQVGSALAYRSIPLQAPYCAAKAALRGFTDSLRSELIHDNSAVRLTMVQLSAFNTPQFDWGRTTMPRRPQPVPPVFQPELAAEAIVRAVLHERREWWVGWPAVQAILAQRLVPGFLDRVLALRGYSAQQGDETLPAEHSDNLYRPPAGDPGAHGRFDAIAHERSIQWWLSVHRAVFAAAAIVLLALLGLWLAL